MPIKFIFGIYFKRLFGFFLKCTPAFETKFKNKFSRKCPVYFPVTLFCFNWSVFYNIEDSPYIKVSKFFLYIHLKTLTLNFVPLFFFICNIIGNCNTFCYRFEITLRFWLDYIIVFLPGNLSSQQKTFLQNDIVFSWYLFVHVLC